MRYPHLLLATAVIVLIALGIQDTAWGTPLYTARAGRTCDNCHSLPNAWADPSEFWKRKCTLSCSSCHVDPLGGGLRNVGGRYFAQNTLPTWGAPMPPLADQEKLWRWIGEKDKPDEPGSEPASGEYIADQNRLSFDNARSDPDDLPTGGPAWGRPFGHNGEMSWWDGRYGKLNADPMLQVGADARLAVWAPGPLLFPMQADLHAAVQPVEHLTFFSTVGARGRAKGFDATAKETPAFGVRDVWVMAHEFPALSYVRAGRFVPPFGWRLDNHTAYVRKGFGLNQDEPEARVLGAEIGLTANYPYASFAAFKPTATWSNNPFEAGEGGGGVLSAGWRDMGWSMGGSLMMRHRPLELEGNTKDISVQWSFNPWYYWENIPITYLGEAAAGTLQRPFSGSETSQLAQYHQISWAAVRGANLHLNYEYWDPDRDVIDDHIHRPSIAVDWTPINRVMVRLDWRFGIPAGSGSEPSPDFLLHVHGWF